LPVIGSLPRTYFRSAEAGFPPTGWGTKTNRSLGIPALVATALTRSSNLSVITGAVGIPSFSAVMQCPATAGEQLLQCPMAITMTPFRPFISAHNFGSSSAYPPLFCRNSVFTPGYFSEKALCISLRKTSPFINRTSTKYTVFPVNVPIREAMGTNGMEGGIPCGFSTVTLFPISCERLSVIVFPSRIGLHVKGERPGSLYLEIYSWNKPLSRSKDPSPQGGASKLNSKIKTEIPKQVRDDKKEKNQIFISSFIPVHRTGFSGVRLIKV
jgi:hypothetical protein